MSRSIRSRHKMSPKVSDAIERLVKTDETRKDNIHEFLERSVKESLQLVNTDFEDILKELTHLSFAVPEDSDVKWRIVCTGCYLLTKLMEYLESDSSALLSISQKLSVKKLLKFIFSNGVTPSLVEPNSTNELDNLKKYNKLLSVCKFVNHIYTNEVLKTVLLTNFMGDYLGGLLQLVYAPIPILNITEMIQRDRNKFEKILDSVILESPKSILIKELMILQSARSHPVLPSVKLAVDKLLSKCLTAPGGLRGLMQCFLDSPHIDTGSQWKHIEMITRLVSVKHGKVTYNEYLENICQQLQEIIDINDGYIIVAAACINALYQKHKDNENLRKLIDTLISPFLCNKEQVATDNVFLTNSKLSDGIFKLDLCFCHPKLSMPPVLLTPIIHTLFLLRICIGKTSALSPKLDTLILTHMSQQEDNLNAWLRAILFGKDELHIPINKNIMFEIVNEEVIGKLSNDCPKINIEQCLNTITEIMENSPNKEELLYNQFLFLFQTLCDWNSIYNITNQNDTTSVERMSRVLLSVTETLENLASNEYVLKALKHKPMAILNLMNKFIIKYSINIKDNKDSCSNKESLTICLVLLCTFVNSGISFDYSALSIIQDPLKIIKTDSIDEETKYLCEEILISLSGNASHNTTQKSKFEEALMGVCDELLPIRAHGLMKMTKLIEEGDTETLSKKEYVMFVFQTNLKDSDSYVYLTAIKGLATLALYLPEYVFDILSKEYLNEDNEKTFISTTEDEKLKLRMKIGEILMKATKNLGDKVLDHKVILLNTFLGGCHDTDDFVRASSLSNLAELCGVLSYKLGDIIFDILKSIDSIIQFDKSLECRRAAVLVISNLIKGLGKESLFFLREALLPMYRTLKALYSDESEDPAVRLHAQIALEELNDIMREIMAPYLKQ